MTFITVNISVSFNEMVNKSTWRNGSLTEMVCFYKAGIKLRNQITVRKNDNARTQENTAISE